MEEMSAGSSHFAILSSLFDSLPLGLVVLDVEGRVVVYNRAEEQLAARSRDHVIGTEFFRTVAPCMNVKELGGLFKDKIGRERIDTTVEMSFAIPFNQQARDVRVRLCSLEVESNPYGFLIVEDISLLRSVERMREKLQSLLVHDLKNPLTAVISNIEFVQEFGAIRDDRDVMGALEDAIDGAKRLNRMTLNLLDLPRLESASMTVRRTPSHVHTLLTRVVNDNRGGARAAEARLTAQPDLGDLMATIDDDLVARALDNLIENAIRHARNVVVSATALGVGGVVITVTDDGPGIPEALRQTLFDHYVQISAPGAARSQNRGLGLTFVRLVAKEHGGDVSLDCPPGGGTIFELRLPPPPAAAP